MTPSNIHMLNSTLLALPAAVVLTRRLLRAPQSFVLLRAAPAGEKPKFLSPSAGTPVERLKNITGYHHDGIND